MKQSSDTILTLDAGGTNLVFKAICDAKSVSSDFVLSTCSDSLEELLQKIISGFREVQKQSGNIAVAISLSFPGPADYDRGIIENPENLPWFKNGIALKKFLENEFNIPVFINNDGDLFTFGEALGGLLPETNKQLREAGVDKQYKNLLGLTLGTGLGGGIVSNGQLWRGDNSAGAEINRMSNFLNRNSSVEEVLSVRGVKKLFSKESNCSAEQTPNPYSIFKIGMGAETGNKFAANTTWKIFAAVLADVVANAVSLVDGLVVIGGGLSGAHPLFLDEVIAALNGHFTNSRAGKFPRLEVSAYNLENSGGVAAFLKNRGRKIRVPFSTETVTYFPDKKIGVGISRLGTSQAVALGAYAYAIDHMGRKLPF